jgi:hypothetical protein
MKKEFILYIAGISLFAFGFIDYSIIIMHVSRTFTGVAAGLQETGSLISSGTLPLLYAGAMLVDAGRRSWRPSPEACAAGTRRRRCRRRCTNLPAGRP